MVRYGYDGEWSNQESHMMETHEIMLRGQRYFAVLDGKVDHPQNVGRLVALVDEAGVVLWKLGASCFWSRV